MWEGFRVMTVVLRPGYTGSLCTSLAGPKAAVVSISMVDDDNTCYL